MTRPTLHDSALQCSHVHRCRRDVGVGEARIDVHSIKIKNPPKKTQKKKVAPVAVSGWVLCTHVCHGEIFHELTRLPFGQPSTVFCVHTSHSWTWRKRSRRHCVVLPMRGHQSLQPKTSLGVLRTIRAQARVPFRQLRARHGCCATVSLLVLRLRLFCVVTCFETRLAATRDARPRDIPRLATPYTDHAQSRGGGGRHGNPPTPAHHHHLLCPLLFTPNFFKKQKKYSVKLFNQADERLPQGLLHGTSLAARP